MARFAVSGSSDPKWPGGASSVASPSRSWKASGVSQATSTGGSPAAIRRSNHRNSAVLPLPRGPVNTMSQGTVPPARRVPRYRCRRACSASRPARYGGSWPLPGMKSWLGRSRMAPERYTRQTSRSTPRRRSAPTRAPSRGPLRAPTAGRADSMSASGVMTKLALGRSASEALFRAFYPRLPTPIRKYLWMAGVKMSASSMTSSSTLH